MRGRTFGTALLAVTAGLALAGPQLASHRAGAATGYTVQSLHFAVTGRPDRQPGTATSSATSTRRPAPRAQHPVPAILTTNGFGGSKADQAAVRRAVRPTRLRRAVLLRARLRRLRLQDHPGRPGLRRPGRQPAGQLPRRRAGHRVHRRRAQPAGRPDRLRRARPDRSRRPRPELRPAGRHEGRLLRRPGPVRGRRASTRGWTRSSRRSPGTTCPTPSTRTTPPARDDPGRDQVDLGGGVLRDRDLRRRAVRRGRPAAAGRLPELRRLRLPGAGHRRQHRLPATADVAALRHASVVAATCPRSPSRCCWTRARWTPCST